ncbi:MAG TPA: DUF2231 domain-containing protein [Candidatus Limnocylindrales bacterium]|nr:DUF2231 domain-containing protein [Candidatus Limnocylindrales bacterium]
MTEVGWTGEERRDGGERRTRFEQWADEERRRQERRRGGIGTHQADPTQRMLDGIHLPDTLAFEPAAGTTGDRIAAASAHGVPTDDPALSHQPEPSTGRALLARLAPAHEPHDAIPSTAAIAGHPLHAAVVPLPIGALAGALVADLAYVATKDPFFARAAKLLTFGGLVTGALAAVLGGIDFWSRGQVRSHRAAWLHAGGNAATLALGGMSLALRSGNARRAVMPWGFVLSAASGLLLLVTGWLGGELSYRHRIGLTEREERGSHDPVAG